MQQLADFVSPFVERSGEKVYLVGHSLGGILSTMMASAHPALAAGVVLLDSPIIGGWRAKTLAAAKASGIVKSISPGKVSYRRTQVWESTEAAYDNFKSKRAFSTWTDACLRDYITYGTHEGADGKRHLSFDRKVETKIYNTLPDNLDAILKKAPLQCPAAFIGGLQSLELKQTGTDLTEKIAQGRMHWVDGGHLFPMEKPQAVAALVDGIVQALEA
jgi:pimeloyl-ACP methyl ester carboxylesterase